MEKKLDMLLKSALEPEYEPEVWLNAKIVNKVKEPMKMNKRRRVSIVTLVTVLVLCVGSVSVYAMWRYLSPDQVAEKTGDGSLAAALTGEDAVVINESQSYGKYKVTLMSIVSGESLSNHTQYHNSIPHTDRSYVVIAIENADGQPLTGDELREAGLYVSFFVSGYKPWQMDVAAMAGSCSDVDEDGIVYRIMSCDNIEQYIGNKLYLCAQDGNFYNVNAYDYDEATGLISRKDTYGGLNALFDVTEQIGRAYEQ